MISKITYHITDTWNHIQVYEENGKYGLINGESDLVVPAEYDSIEWDKSSDFIVVQLGERTGFLSADDGHFMDFDDEDPEDPYMMAIPYEEYMKEEWPEWMINPKQ